MNVQEFILLLIAIIGCIVGIDGRLSSRKSNTSDDAHWKGTVDEKLSNIQSGVSGVGERMAKVEGTIATLSTQNAIHTTKLKEHDSQIQELKQKFEEQEKTA